MLHFYNIFAKNQFDYASPSHFSYGRWVSYFNQINEILKLGSKGDSILEIGPGAKVTYDVLTRFGFKITTVDIDEDNNPDISCDIRNLTIEDGSFDIIACFEILEHIPYSDFMPTLTKLYNISRKHCIISLPTFGFEFALTLKFPPIPKLPVFRPFGRNLTFSTILCLPIPIKKKPEPFHQWEIGRFRYPLRRIKRDIVKSGFTISQHFYVPEHPWFTFFVLKK